MTTDNTALADELIKVITDMISAEGIRPDRNITQETYLGADLQLKSLDFIRLVTAINQHFNMQNVPFQNLFIADDGTMVEDIQIKYLADFLMKYNQ